MSPQAVDHRRATAERNAAAILDATERLVASGATLSMAGVAAEAKVSRPTLYAHFPSLSALVEAAVARVIESSISALQAAQPEVGPADEALQRVLDASWTEIAKQDGLARAAAEHLPAARLHAQHAPLMGHLAELLRRGQREGTIRNDLPVEWLVRSYVALVHAADDYARTRGMKRSEARAHLALTMRDLVAVR
jgi:TetR/AcrR family transcriptional repressor of mexCD-oprJ operon